MKFLKVYFLLCMVFSFGLAAEKKITVIGAGLAGLTSAYRLEQLIGGTVDIYEARDRPGGRIYTVFIGDDYEELGGKSLTDGGESLNIKALISEMGLEIDVYQANPFVREYVYKNKKGFYYDAFQNAPMPDEKAFLLLKDEAQMADNFENVLDYFLKDHDLLRHLAELRTRNFEGNDSKDLATSYLESFWHAYKMNYDAVHCDKVDVYTFEQIRDGNSRLINALAEAINGTIHYGYALQKISKDGQKIILYFANGSILITDYLILAIPCSTLRDVEIEEGILPYDQKYAIQSLQYGSNSKILVPIIFGENSGSQFGLCEEELTFFNKNKTIMTLYCGGKAGCFASDSKELNNQINQAMPALKMLYPNTIFLDHSPIGISWINEKFSKGSYSSWGVDQFDLFNEKKLYLGEVVRKVFRPIDDKIFFAGEHTATEYPATMEGAVESGERTARMVQLIYG